MGDSLSSILGIVLQETGANPNLWGDIINLQLQKIERAIRGAVAVDLTLGNVELTADQAGNGQIFLTGTPDADRIVTVPAKAARWEVTDLTTSNKKITFKNATDTGVTIPRKGMTVVSTDGFIVTGGAGRLDGTGGLSGGIGNDVTTIPITAGMVTPYVLTDEQAANPIIVLTGTMTKDLVIHMPAKKARKDFLNRAINPQPAVGTGGDLGTIVGGRLVGSTYPTPGSFASRDEALAAFSTANLSANTKAYLSNVIAGIKDGFFEGAATYTAGQPNLGVLTGIGVTYYSQGAVYEYGNPTGVSFKGTYILFLKADGVPWLYYSERGNSQSGYDYNAVNLYTGEQINYRGIGPGGVPYNGSLDTKAVNYVQSVGIRLFNQIQRTGVNLPAVPPPDPIQAFSVTVKTPAGTGVIVDAGLSSLVCDGVNVYGGAGVDGTGADAMAMRGTPPIGSIIFGAGTIFLDPRVRWLECVGQFLNPSAYPRLFESIGTKWGGDGANTFRLPDLRNQFLRVYGGNNTRVGEKVNDSIRSHTHTAVIGTAGLHSHAATSANQADQIISIWQSLFDIDGNKAGDFNGENIYANENEGPAPRSRTILKVPAHTHPILVADGGNHIHICTVAATGDLETAPVHAIVKAWIRVK